MRKSLVKKQDIRIPFALGFVGFLVFMLASNGLILGTGAEKSFFAIFLFDFGSSVFPYPATIQNLMWLTFFIGLSDLYISDVRSKKNEAQLKLQILPEDDSTMLSSNDLTPIYRKLKGSDAESRGFLQRLLLRCILQFQANKSVDQTNMILNSSLELLHHEVDLAYTMTRFISWLVPTLGFIGTVVGIAFALAEIGKVQSVEELQDPAKLIGAIQSLGVAFYTTLLALLQSAVLVCIGHIVQAREERSLNKAGEYCIDNLINRLYT